MVVLGRNGSACFLSLPLFSRCAFVSDSILLEGKKGHGKSLVQVKLIRTYMRSNRMVATNLNLFLENLLPPLSTATAIRLPDFPTAADLEMIGISTAYQVAKKEGWQKVDEYTNQFRTAVQPDTSLRDKFLLTDEDQYGLLNLDEVGSFLNSRNWQGKDRLDVIGFLSQCRKYGWDALLSAQHHKMVDAQIRTALCDIRGVAKRLDKIAVPFFSAAFKYVTGKRLKLPKIHLATFFYGFDHGAPVSFREVYTGSDVWDGYDTTQKISGDFGNQHTFCYLSAWHLKGRYMTPLQLHGRIAMASLIAGLFVGAIGGFFYGKTKLDLPASVSQQVEASKDVFVTGVMDSDGQRTVLLSDGTSAKVSAFKLTVDSQRYKVGDTWYEVKK